jgi:hypothetical protein
MADRHLPPLGMWGLYASHWQVLGQHAVQPEVLLAAFTSLLYSAACADMLDVSAAALYSG